MADTEYFIREEVRSFLDMLKAIGSPGIEQVGAEVGRQQMRALGSMAEAQPHPLPVIHDLSCPGPGGEIPLRLYDTQQDRGPGPCVVFLHGGGFVIGDIGVYNALCTEISRQLDLPVVSVEYRLAPEHPFPAAPDDCEAAARWIASSPEELGRDVTGLIVMGDSAGGNLTIVTSAALTATPADIPVLIQAPMYPIADDISEHESLRRFGDGYLLNRETMAFFTRSYAAEPGDPRNLPMLGDCSGAPPTVLCTAGLDPLRDSGRNYAANLIQQGTDVVYLEFPGIIHGFMTLRKVMPSGQGDLTAFLDAVALMLRKQDGQ